MPEKLFHRVRGAVGVKLSSHDEDVRQRGNATGMRPSKSGMFARLVGKVRHDEEFVEIGVHDCLQRE